MKGFLILQIVILFLVLIFFPITVVDAKRLKLATTTSIANSGILSPLLSAYREKQEITVHPIITGTGKALELGKYGDVDLVLTHAPKLEHLFIKKKYGINKKKIMFNYFLVAGPSPDYFLSKSEKVVDVLKQIAKKKYNWISRGDNSGTHVKEIELWKNAKLNPLGEWYLSSGLGMGRSLIIAEEKNAFILSDRGTYLSFLHRNKINLKIVFGRNDKNLLNVYSVIQVNPFKHKNILYTEAKEFSDFLLSNTAQCIIENFKIKQIPLFYPASSCISKQSRGKE
tara:strand:+ start:202 stop:1050 length:849 start_codon:yes stop_codon:yes gene_type:complete